MHLHPFQRIRIIFTKFLHWVEFYCTGFRSSKNHTPLRVVKTLYTLLLFFNFKEHQISNKPTIEPLFSISSSHHKPSSASGGHNEKSRNSPVVLLLVVLPMGDFAAVCGLIRPAWPDCGGCCCCCCGGRRRCWSIFPCHISWSPWSLFCAYDGRLCV